MAEIQAKPAAEGKPADSIFRQKSMDRVSSPEALDDYIRVTTPSVWIVLIALAVLLAGVLAWIFIGSRGAAAPMSFAEFRSLSAEQQKQTFAALSGPEIAARFLADCAEFPSRDEISGPDNINDGAKSVGHTGGAQVRL